MNICEINKPVYRVLDVFCCECKERVFDHILVADSEGIYKDLCLECAKQCFLLSNTIESGCGE